MRAGSCVSMFGYVRVLACAFIVLASMWVVDLYYSRPCAFVVIVVLIDLRQSQSFQGSAQRAWLGACICNYSTFHI